MADGTGAFDLHGTVAVVTGASSGFGAHFARVLHRAGATVALLARRADRIDALAAELPGSLAVPVDLGTAPGREEAMATVLDRLGRVDVLVNNAGIGIVGPALQEPLADFEAVVQLNLVATWHLATLAGADMVARGSGSIVNVASMLGLVASAAIPQSGYVASKGAVVSLTRELANQWGPAGVRVNAIAPGWFPTEMTADMADERSQAYVARGAPLGRMGRLDELDGPLLLLASDAGSYITGTTIVVDGGWTAR